MISIVEKVLFLKSVDLFCRIPGEDLAQVAQITREVHFESGSTIIQEGDLGDSMFLIVEGEVTVHRNQNHISTLTERQSFGEMAILDHEPRSASVTASSEVTCLKIEREDFYDLMSEKIEIAYGIIRLLAYRLRESNQTVGGPSNSNYQ